MDNRYNLILSNTEYKEKQARLDELEKDREFCRHGLLHLIDVCRILYIMVLSEGLSISKDVVYAAGLLHDIGREDEYNSNISHDEASAQFAAYILPSCGYSDDEICLVTQAIRGHRRKNVTCENTSKISNNENCTDISERFAYFLKLADKKSRRCFECMVYKECNWDEDMKNKDIY